MCLSEPQTAVARTRISTSAGPGSGTGPVRTSVACGPGAGFVLTTAVIWDGRREAGNGNRAVPAGAILVFDFRDSDREPALSERRALGFFVFRFPFPVSPPPPPANPLPRHPAHSRSARPPPPQPPRRRPR